MKNRKFIYSKITWLLLVLFFIINVSCERDISEDAEFATFPNTAEVFLDTPIGLGSNFYFPYGGSKPTAWSVDDEVSYKGMASMRFDVPNANDPEGNYAGAIFRIDGDGSGRNLTGFDALTFWAKASQAVTVGEIGFGEDFGENKYIATLTNVDLTTNWVKYIIPIPDPSKLVQERGMLRYSAGGIGPAGSEVGYSFWIDEVQFEKLGTIAQPQPTILGGEDVSEQTFIGTTINLAEPGLTQTFNLSSGINQTVVAAPSYFTFSSSDNDVAQVSETGIVTIINSGTAKITATLGGVKALGSLTLESIGNFEESPVPTRDANNVISIFSDAYNNVAVDYYNGFFTPDGQTTLGGQPPLILGSGEVINYTLLNFVGIGMFLDVPTINATAMTHLHVDINVQEAIDSGDFINLQLLNQVGPSQTSGTVRIDGSQLTTDQWVSLDVPLADFTGLGSRNEIGLLFFISDTTISNIYVDNIYFYKE
ncbi:Ig-like domain-containing protein [Thalassobellus citreus]|uniref:Ig-like domain-containing protein n=1 Tax=Thalassobellus citreus TaxID=3367752 RepID=UPI0037908B3A